MGSAALRTAVATVAFAGLHSLLASRGVKRLAERAVGTRVRNGAYRAAYNAVSVGTTAALVGQAVFRHKRRKVGFMVVFAAIALGHLVGWAVYFATAW